MYVCVVVVLRGWLFLLCVLFWEGKVVIVCVCVCAKNCQEMSPLQTLILSLPNANLTKPRKLLKPEPSNKI